MTHIKVLTLNLWDVGESLDHRDALLAAGLKRLQPDIVCLQEVSRRPATQRARSELFAAPCGLTHHLFSGLGESEAHKANLPRNMEGLAILSRFPALRQTRVALPYFAGDIPRQIFLAELAVGASRIAVATTHLAFPPAFLREREIQVRKALDAVDQFTAQAGMDTIILTGDFNEEPGSPAVQAVLASRHGFLDAYFACHPDDRGATFTSTNPFVGPGFVPGQRIDFIFATRKLEPVESTLVFNGTAGLEFVSDHLGVCCVFALK
jgi:endonuclease/exonuclease/phosphatase family metal-dependent hydrolase